MVAVPITGDEPESAQNQTICARLSSPTDIAFTSSYSAGRVWVVLRRGFPDLEVMGA